MTPTAEQAAQRITEALEKGPTEGEWIADEEYVSQAGVLDVAICSVMCMDEGGAKDYYRGPITRANQELIAAASPAALRVLMAERAEWSDRTAEAQAERDVAREERDELLKDAARWRWIREHSFLLGASSIEFGPGFHQTKPESLDVQIDHAGAARASAGEAQS